MAASSSSRSFAVIFLVVSLAAMAAEAAGPGSGAFYVDGHGMDADTIDTDLEQELLLDTESNRRLLNGGGSKYLSYAALARNAIPCGQRGQSYYNCRDHQVMNPYQRGCREITRCARQNR